MTARGRASRLGLYIQGGFLSLIVFLSLAACGEKPAAVPTPKQVTSAPITELSATPTLVPSSRDSRPSPVRATSTVEPTSAPTATSTAAVSATLMVRPTRTSSATATEALPVTPTASKAEGPVVSAAVTPRTPSATPPTPTPGPAKTPAKSPAARTPAPAVEDPDQRAAARARLEKGRWLQSIGDCAAARREFADLLASEPGPAGDPRQGAEASEARYRLAQCYLRDGAPAEATTVLKQLLASAAKSDPYRAPANFILGEALSQLGKWAEAEASYRAYLPLAPEIKTLTWQRIGTVSKAAGDLPGATQAYTTALQSSFDWTNTVAIRRALADLAAAQGNYRGAVAQYDLLRGKATNNAWAAEMQWLAGSALAKAGDQAEAQRRWQATVDADPTSRFAHQAMVALVEAGVAVDEYQRGLVDYHSGLYELAIAAFDRLRVGDPTGRNGAAWYYTGLSYLALGQTDRGLGELGNLIAAYPGSPLWADAWLAKGRALATAGKTVEAIGIYTELAKQRPDAPQAPKALWQAANLQVQAGRTAEAVETYLALARHYTASDEGWRAYHLAGLYLFRSGDWRQAGAIWSEMAEAELPSWTRPVAYYWLGRAQAAAGESEAAQRSWQAAWKSGRDTYFGLRAAEWAAASVGQPQTGPTRQPTPQPLEQPLSPSQEIKELSAWLRDWAGAGTLALPPALLADPDWKRGQTLLTLGLRSQALAAWGRVQQRYAKDPWASAALSIAFRDAGAYRLSILSAEGVVSLWTGGIMRDAPLVLQRLAYPFAYAELIRSEAAKWGLDPRLLAAVIRQESHFETGATSSAGAQGLMQVMPGTAQGIASRLGWRGFEPKQAYWPYTNVALGANYVATWLTHFNGSIAAALAAYNGGPGNAAVWRNWAPTDDDLMVALINIGETRVYVQTVYAQYETYQQLYTK